MASDTNDEPRSSTPSALLPRPLPVILAIYAAYNVVAPIVMALAARKTLSFEGELVIVVTLLALALSESGFLSVWAVWAPQPAMTRNGVALLAVLIGYLIFFFALWVAPGAYNDNAWSVLFLPLMFFSLQLPQWVFKFALGAHMNCRTPPPASGNDARRFSIGQLLATTGLVAASLAAARLGSSLVGIDDEAAGGSAMLMLFVFAVGAGSGLLLVVPSVWAILMARRVRRGIAFLTVYAIFLSSAAAYWLAVEPGDMTVFLAVFLALGGTLVGLCASLGVLRRCGYSVCRAEPTNAYRKTWR